MSRLEIFLFNLCMCYGICLPLTVFIAASIEIEFKKVLQQSKTSGSKEINLDALQFDK